MDEERLLAKSTRPSPSHSIKKGEQARVAAFQARGYQSESLQ